MVKLQSILGPDGAIARRLGERYEHRPQQLEMAAAVGQTLTDGGNLLVEAGTGVGKSFAYLLPAIDFAVRTRKRVVISTHTISLQEQLINKDIPLIQAVYPDEFAAVLVKGRGNYLCRRRLDQTIRRSVSLFDDERQREGLYAIDEWAGRTTDGSLSDLPVLPDGDVWQRVCAEGGNCLGKKCQYYQDCFWQAARRRMHSGRILIVNHALFFSDLALRAAGVNYLPKYDAVILDEAHTVEDVAGDHFGLKVTESGLRYQLRTLYDPKREKGLLTTHGPLANDAIRDVIELHRRLEGFFGRCAQYQSLMGRSNGRIHEPNWIENDLSPKLRDLALHLKAMLTDLEAESEISEISSQSERAANSAQVLDAVISHGLENAVYWMDISTRAGRRVSLHAAPINIASGLRMHLFEKVHAVVMTSATMCTAAGREGHAAKRVQHGQEARSEVDLCPGVSPVNDNAETSGHGPDARATGGATGAGSGSRVTTGVAGVPANPKAFEYIKSRLGVDEARTLVLGSPFDYSTQATLYVESDLPEPNDPTFLPAACERIIHYLQQTNGGAFVLFTAYGMLNQAARILGPTLARMQLPVLIQGQGPPPRILLDRFRSTPNAVLLGTSSFWQGIDVQGDSLRNVIVVKLPFSVPDDPVVEARLDAIKRRGGNPFMEYSVPEAIIRLKQGFGRLIRSRTDQGIVVILDSRVKTKRYGKLFLDALPDCRQG